ncbi:putative transposase [Magnetofaba australis IT-1]|uniref:Putative transposase n=1 Tax=Magnetofaba australis IT-1 TaxID=1434232 RepID=A0A1Y2K8H1_9PROT|nr:putative transposase [Magnetofaba australis IT-1]
MALDAIRRELTLSELATKHGIHPTPVTKWEKAAMEGMAGIFPCPPPESLTKIAARKCMNSMPR